MATITSVAVPNPDVRFALRKWEGFTTNGDVGDSVDTMGGYQDRSVQVLGDFGTSGAITIEGSNDGGTTWATLTDGQGNDLVITAAKIEAIAEVTHAIRPRLSAGSGSIDLDVHIFFAGNRR